MSDPNTETTTTQPPVQPPVSNPEPAQPVAVKPPRILNIIAFSIQPDNRGPVTDPSSGLAKEWFLTYVKDAQQCVKPCTASVWIWAQQAKPWLDTRAEWILNLDQNDANRIVGVRRKPVIDKGPLSPRLDISPDNLMLQKLGSTFEPLNLPILFATPRLEEAVDAMNTAGRARAGELIGNGKFIVKSVISMENDNTIYVLEIAKQA